MEHMIGPARWQGTLAGRALSDGGFFERTLAFYRGWELADDCG